MAEGEFRYSYGAAVDVELEEERVGEVIEHELIHGILYGSTTYGQLTMMLDKNKLWYSPAEEMLNGMFMFMNRMQERTAINAEVIKAFIQDGIDAYQEAISRLQCRNKTYYNHFRKLCCINGKVNSKENAMEISNMIIELARIALNVDLDGIPFERMKTKTSIVSFFQRDENARKYSPNRRFDILVNTLFRKKNNNNNDIDSVILGSIPLEEMGDNNFIRDRVLKKTRSIFSDSPLCNRLMERCASVTSMVVSEEYNKYLGTRPVKLSTNNPMLQFVIKTEDEFWKFFEKFKCTEVYVLHRLGGFEDFPYALSLKVDNINRKEIYTFWVGDENKFYKFINKIKCNIIFDKLKLLCSSGKIIKKMISKLPIFIYCDVAIGGLMQQIKHFFVGGKYGYVECENYLLIVISKKSFIFLAHIIKDAIQFIDNLLLEYKIMKCDDVNEFCDYKEVMRIDELCDYFEPVDFNDIVMAKI